MLSGVLLIIFSAAVAWLVGKIIPTLRRMQRCRCIPALPGDKLIGGHIDMFGPVMTGREREKLYAAVRERQKISRGNFSFGLPLWIDLIHPDVVSAVYNSNIEPKDCVSYRTLAPLLGNSLLLAGGAEWKRKRGLVKQAFTRQQIRSFFTTFRSLADELVECWSRRIDSEGTVNSERGKREVSFIIDEHVSKLTLESFMRCAFCLPSPNWMGEDNEFLALSEEFDNIIAARFNGNPLKLVDSYFYISAAGQAFKNVCHQMLQKTKLLVDRRREVLDRFKLEGQSESVAECLLDILLTARDVETGNELADEDLIFESQLFLSAGHNTTTQGLIWTLYLLGCHPEEVRRCQEEIDNVLSYDDELTLKAMDEMPYVTQCIKESLRLYPPVINEQRILPKDTVIDGYTVPAGMIVQPATEAIHRNPDFWENPHGFFPEHFSPEQQAKRHPGAFRPFSSGPRKCIGEAFAMEQMKVITITLLRQFDFVVDPDHVVTDTMRILLKPANGIKLILCHRHV